MDWLKVQTGNCVHKIEIDFRRNKWLRKISNFLGHTFLLGRGWELQICRGMRSKSRRLAVEPCRKKDVQFLEALNRTFIISSVATFGSSFRKRWQTEILISYPITCTHVQRWSSYRMACTQSLQEGLLSPSQCTVLYSKLPVVAVQWRPVREDPVLRVQAGGTVQYLYSTTVHVGSMARFRLKGLSRKWIRGRLGRTTSWKGHFSWRPLGQSSS